jgi:hypothetical protein
VHNPASGKPTVWEAMLPDNPLLATLTAKRERRALRGIA